MGVIVHNINDKTGLLASVSCVDESKDVMVITNEGTIIRTATDVIPTYKRSTTGVRIMKLNENAIVANTTLVDKEDEEEISDSLAEGEELPATPAQGEAIDEENNQNDKPQGDEA